MTTPNTCPRRLNELGPWERTEGLDIPVAGRCPFCGSITPETFLERARDGNQLVPTDKPYKVYLGDTNDKFYFQHLTNEQRREFFDLFQSGRLNLGYPGHFYVLPFFIKILEVPSDSTSGS